MCPLPAILDTAIGEALGPGIAFRLRQCLTLAEERLSLTPTADQFIDAGVSRFSRRTLAKP